MKLILLTLSLVALLTGCERSDGERRLLSQQSANHPELVLIMHDGRSLYRVVIAGDYEQHDHYVYFFSTNDVNTVSVNYSVQHGKTYSSQTIVVDGVTYQAVTNN